MPYSFFQHVRRAFLFMLRFAPIVLAVLLLILLDNSETPTPTKYSKIAETQPAQNRLIIFWIDSLAKQDMAPESPHMPRLKKRLTKSLHGPVETCIDAISVPCFVSMATGTDSFSLFSLFSNFGGAHGMPDGNIFQVLQKNGHRIGFVGAFSVSAVTNQFDWVEIHKDVNDPLSVKQALKALNTEKLSAVVIHLYESDKTSHVHSANSPEYAAALDRADQLIEESWKQLKPNDHVVVMGDHGHMNDGRHFTGLDVPTYAAFFGKTFSRTLEYPMHVTDYGKLWARVFGIQFGESTWMDAYFSGNSLPAPMKSQDEQQSSQGSQAPFLIAILASLAFLIPYPLRKNWVISQPNQKTFWYSFVPLAIASIAFGALWSQMRFFIHGGNFLFNVPFVTMLAVIGAFLLSPHFSQLRSSGLCRTSTILILMLYGGIFLAPATVYKQGGVFCAITIMVLGFIFSWGLAHKARHWKLAILFLFSIAVWASIWNPAVGNFTVFRFYTNVLDSFQNLTLLIFAAMIIFLAAWPRNILHFFHHTTRSVNSETTEISVKWLLAGFLGLCIAIAHDSIPAQFFIIPCALSLPTLLLAHRKPAYEPLAFFFTIPSLTFFFQLNPNTLAPVAACILLWQLWAYLRNNASSLQSTAELVILVWTTLWTSMGCRINGITFNYFFKWLPEGSNVTETWKLQSILTVALYSTPVLLGILLARHISPHLIEKNTDRAWRLARFKLLFVFLFIIGFSIQHVGAGPFLISDVLQESMIWMLIIFFLGLSSHRNEKHNAASSPYC